MVQHHNDDDDSDHNAAFASGNVHLITTKENWEEKLAEASKDGKIVSSSILFCSGGRSRPCHMVSLPFSLHACTCMHTYAQMGIRQSSY